MPGAFDELDLTGGDDDAKVWIHEIRNTGRSVLRTLNFYSPPAYTHAGDELPAARNA